MNLPTRAGHEPGPDATGTRPPLREWLDGRLLGCLVIAFSALFTLLGTELAVIAALRANGQMALTGVVIAAMSLASIAGGLVYGSTHRSLPAASLALLMGVLVLPAGAFGSTWWLLAVALIPMNLMCTPTLAANTDAISRLAPAQARGEAMGLRDSASRLGIALGSPVVGLAIDRSSPGWGFAAAGLAGLAFTGIGMLFQQSSTPPLPKPKTSEADAPA
jgi:predicted MFS family arabinose efflux permease